VYGEAAKFVTHGPVTLVASKSVPRGQVSNTFAPEMFKVMVLNNP
jgi:hypothetical protein